MNFHPALFLSFATTTSENGQYFALHLPFEAWDLSLFELIETSFEIRRNAYIIAVQSF